jgi:hypothetical protein
MEANIIQAGLSKGKAGKHSSKTRQMKEDKFHQAEV